MILRAMHGIGPTPKDAAYDGLPFRQTRKHLRFYERMITYVRKGQATISTPRRLCRVRPGTLHYIFERLW